VDPKDAKPETKPETTYEEEVDYGESHDWDNYDPPDYGPDYGEGFRG
jgi:hypothetical protein